MVDINSARTQVARSLSSDSEGGFYGHAPDIEQLCEDIVNFHDAANVDKRQIAIGNDAHFGHYEATAKINEDLISFTWPFMAYRKMIFDVMTSGATVEQPKKILMSIGACYDYKLELLANPKCDVTIVNDLELLYMEKFRLNPSQVTDMLNKFGSINYKMITPQAMKAGEADGQYDLVVTQATPTFGVTNKMMRSFMNAVKLDGLFSIYDMSAYQELYLDPTGVGTTFWGDYGRLIVNDKRFISYHIPVGLSMVISKRVS